MALAIVKGLSDSLKYHQLTEIKVNLIPPESQQSKLKSKDDLPSQSYQVQAELELNLAAIERLKKRAGRFVLATNDLEKKRLSSEDILKNIKGNKLRKEDFLFSKTPAFLPTVSFSNLPIELRSGPCSWACACWFILLVKDNFV